MERFGFSGGWAKGSYHVPAKEETAKGRIDPVWKTRESTDFQRRNWNWASHWGYQTLANCAASVNKPDSSFCRWCNGNCLWLTQLPLQPSTISGCLIWNRCRNSLLYSVTSYFRSTLFASAPLCYSRNSRSFFSRIADNGSWWNGIRRARYCSKCQSVWISSNSTWSCCCFSQSTLGAVGWSWNTFNCGCNKSVPIEWVSESGSRSCCEPVHKECYWCGIEDYILIQWYKRP